jgi:glycosyltransferase involved in cell wall biosynthesis
MLNNSLVSVIIIFLNAADFLQEAVESVLAQTYENWELLLVDDGSTDQSTQIAHQYTAQYQGKVFYLEHCGHQNRGKGVSRNLGIRHARGEYIAFLDADDIWMPNKLEQQVAILFSHPEAGMLYGDTLYWYSWTGNPEDTRRDFIPDLGVETNTLIYPPRLIPLFLRGRVAVPCTCSILVRRKVIEEVNGFDETCQEINNFYEDQAFYTKICLVTPVVAVKICWDKYRQRSTASVEDLERFINQENHARKYFLRWLEGYLIQCGINQMEISEAIRKELWLIQFPSWLANKKKAQIQIRWVKKRILRLVEVILPKSISRRLWSKK